MKSIKAILFKEIQSEFRTRYAISTILLFVFTTVMMIVFATAGTKLDNHVLASIYWIIMFFGAMTGLAKSFVSEEERGTYLLLQLNSKPYAVYFGKLIFNILLALLINLIAIILALIFYTQLVIESLGLFIFIIFLSSVAIAAATTIISALIAKANSKSALFPILSFPILLPIIILGINLTDLSFTGASLIDAHKDLQLIFAYTGLMIVVSYFLFDFVWED
ncbi:MAG TPA: heme exporter protein CcmB [Candidatus Kapabacteria bacterium]|nr:heme exporter protein CcmB [Candidatus Kapabacteria bacterium]